MYAYAVAPQFFAQIYLPYLFINIIEQGKKKGVKVSQEEGKDTSQLPLEGYTGMIIFQLCYGFK